MASKRGIQHLRELQILSIVQEYSIGVRAGILAIALGAASIATSAASLAQSPVSSNAHPVVDDSLAGRSGKLKARIVAPRRGTGIRILRELFGDSAGDRPGIYRSTDSSARRPFSLITLLPFHERVRGEVGGYRLGFWPGERRGSLRSELAPEGFIEVTSSNQDTPLSDHFRLRDFLTHNQGAVWPKYLVLRDALVDKLELVISDLQARGYAVAHMQVMSGFRTPDYNALGVGRRGGRARDSRHQYGDAADVFVDNNRDGHMDDLNHDGRVDMRDARVVLESIERVELQHPDLVGGAGLYKATSAHGPFVHVDVRGARARWGRG